MLKYLFKLDQRNATLSQMGPLSLLQRKKRLIEKLQKKLLDVYQKKLSLDLPYFSDVP